MHILRVLDSIPLLGCRFPQAYAYYTAASCVPIRAVHSLNYAYNYLCLPLTRCINFCCNCIPYLVLSVFHLYFVSIVILQNAENK